MYVCMYIYITSSSSLLTEGRHHKVTGIYSVKLPRKRSRITRKRRWRIFLLHFKVNFWEREKMQKPHVVWVHVCPLHSQASRVRLALFHLGALCKSSRAKSNKISQLFMIPSALTPDWSARLQLRVLVSLQDVCTCCRISGAGRWGERRQGTWWL